MVRQFFSCCFGLLVAPILIAQGIIKPGSDAGEQLRRQGLSQEFSLPRLHLGCGQHHFSGYINIDYPLTEHTVQQVSGADVFADITQMRFNPLSVQEVRLHHLFEHFDRSMALALCCAWHLWLVQEGTLCIEVPDFATSITMLTDKQYSYEQKQVIMRHIFGSHEASWAIHCDGWYQEKFEHILSILGFDEIVVTHSSWKLTHNITVQAKKLKILTKDQLLAAAYTILRESMVDASESEQRVVQQWLQKVISSLEHLIA